MAYSLTTHYAGQGLLESFNFLNGSDRNGGFVDYQNRENALALGLVSVDDSNRVLLGVDAWNTYDAQDSGRPSVRLSSNEVFNDGLWIADFAHMPASTCGVWPSFWAFNIDEDEASMPNSGELGIVGGANTERNTFSAHTGDGCTLPKSGFSGEQRDSYCGPHDHGDGCSYASPTDDLTSFGNTFNAEGGGVYALEWDGDEIKMWHFARNQVPGDIVDRNHVTPNPNGWGPPHAIFGGAGCHAHDYFHDLNLIININLCGDYVNSLWAHSQQCSQLAPTCEEYVGTNPTKLASAYWSINAIDHFRKGVPPQQFNAVSKLSQGGSAGMGPDRVVGFEEMQASTTPASAPAVNAAAPGEPQPSTTVTYTSLQPSFTRTITLSSVMQTPQPTDPATGASSNPIEIGDWSLLGCLGSTEGWKPFVELNSLAHMDNEACAATCREHKFAAVYADMCYCSDSLGDGVAVELKDCDRPCPGNAREFCGGRADTTRVPPFGAFALPAAAAGNSSSIGNSSAAATPRRRSPVPIRRRNAPADFLFTVYARLNHDSVPPAPPAMGREDPEPQPEPTPTPTPTPIAASSSGPVVIESGAYSPVVVASSSSAAPTPTPVVISSGAYDPVVVASSSTPAPPSVTTITMQLPSTVVSTLTTTYTTICSTNPALLVTVEYCHTTTVTVEGRQCGCTETATPAPAPSSSQPQVMPSATGYPEPQGSSAAGYSSYSAAEYSSSSVAGYSSSSYSAAAAASGGSSAAYGGSSSSFYRAATTPAPPASSYAAAAAAAAGPAPTVAMTTCVETCQACGPSGESTVTLTVPAALVTATTERVITKTAYQTVVPIQAPGTGGSSWNKTGPAVAPSPLSNATVVTGRPPPSAPTATATAGTGGMAEVLGWGLAAWLGAFGVLMTL